MATRFPRELDYTKSAITLRPRSLLKSSTFDTKPSVSQLKTSSHKSIEPSTIMERTVTQYRRLAKSNPATSLILISLVVVVGCGTPRDRNNDLPTPSPIAHELPRLTRSQVFEARRNFKIEVLSFDASKGYGERDPVSGYCDYVRLRITNNSDVILPYLTVKTIRANQFGEIVGWSRVPSIPTDAIKPGDTIDIDYYPKGHMDSFIALVDKIVVVIETENKIGSASEQFFRELQNLL